MEFRNGTSGFSEADTDLSGVLQNGQLGCDQSEALSWHVLYVKSRQEKALAEDLDRMKIQYYLPLVRELHYYSRRKSWIETPLFPGYIFLQGLREDAFRADRTKRVLKILNVVEQEILTEDIRNVRLALENQGFLKPHPYLKKGCRVEVRSGPFQGMRGLVVDPEKLDRIVLQVQILGQAISMEIEASLLEVISEFHED